jgi:hypothetical protein
MQFQLAGVPFAPLGSVGEDDSVMLPISHRPTEDFETYGTDIATVDTPIDCSNVGYELRACLRVAVAICCDVLCRACVCGVDASDLSCFKRWAGMVRVDWGRTARASASR